MARGSSLGDFGGVASPRGALGARAASITLSAGTSMKSGDKKKRLDGKNEVEKRQ